MPYLARDSEKETGITSLLSPVSLVSFAWTGHAECVWSLRDRRLQPQEPANRSAGTAGINTSGNAATATTAVTATTALSLGGGSGGRPVCASEQRQQLYGESERERKFERYSLAFWGNGKFHGAAQWDGSGVQRGDDGGRHGAAGYWHRHGHAGLRLQPRRLGGFFV